ncbi:Hsp20/alpha crystallin family protein [Glycomyces dulcitolivorans]|uniref:Hsp20/alpha crystallin family protein n=1 Tax=Glycomyces dulcitolivorans TaxID=2200759 RepID=UPI000DD2D9F0|nr:Hsp20/alpha crystallin family protein [Glycomyces dulcitolivorans]
MIVRYQHPYAAFRQFDREFERLVRTGFGRGAVQYSLRADVLTEGEDLVVRAAVPGVAAEDVTVELDGRRLSITAERKARETAEGDRYLVRGLSSGSFRREFTLPEGTTAEQLSAGVADGILTVRISAAVKPAPEAVRIPVTGAPVEVEAETTESE